MERKKTFLRKSGKTEQLENEILYTKNKISFSNFSKRCIFQSLNRLFDLCEKKAVFGYRPERVPHPFHPLFQL